MSNLPQWQSKENGIKVDGKQNDQYKDCKRQFIGDHALSSLGCKSGITRKILQLMVRGSGIRDIAEVERIISVKFYGL